MPPKRRQAPSDLTREEKEELERFLKHNAPPLERQMQIGNPVNRVAIETVTESGEGDDTEEYRDATIKEMIDYCKDLPTRIQGARRRISF